MGEKLQLYIIRAGVLSPPLCVECWCGAGGYGLRTSDIGHWFAMTELCRQFGAESAAG